MYRGDRVVSRTAREFTRSLVGRRGRTRLLAGMRAEPTLASPLPLTNNMMILKLLISVVFLGAVVQKFTGKVASQWERWGFSRQKMYAAGAAEVVGLALFWWPGLELAGAAMLALVLFGALGTLTKHREGAAHIALPALTLLLVIAQSYLSLRA